ncbi:uncharacterized protein [Lepeophtheirus salmonis]|uniref:PNPLA domain-containing protein n=1 Tax=Lepeophtheirus salmonis TaxID=72036 RepID=A0A0K2T4D9_LEPSM|nr:patanin-like phospholipase domain-containing protein atgl-1 isoform X1 [Lepeophtheirus salmonis]
MKPEERKVSRRELQNLSFAGCGFLGIYHVGVSAAMRQYAPDLIFNKISGASAGAMAAVCLIAGTPLREMANKILSACAICRSHVGGAFNPAFNISTIIEDSLTQILPENVHELVNGKLHISVTRVYDGTNVIISNFVSKKELIEAVVASSFIPIFSGIMPYRYRGIRVIDGGFSVNAPKLDDGTITVSPFAGEYSICPKDSGRNKMLHRLYLTEIGHNISIENLGRIVKVLYPPSPGVLAEMCSEGFRDAIAYLQKNNLISCNRCLCTISSIYSKNNSDLMQKSEEIRKNETEMESSSHLHKNGTTFEGDCIQCQKEIEDSKESVLPEQVTSVFEDMMNKADYLKQKSYLYRYVWPILRYTPPVIITRWFLNISLSMGEKVYSTLANHVPYLRDEEKVFQLLENGLISLLNKISKIHEIPPEEADNKWYFACDVNVTQIGDQTSGKNMAELDSVDGAPTDDDKFLSLEITSVIENNDQNMIDNSDAIRFQADNLWNAVHAHASNTYVSSRKGSLAVTEILSTFNSKRNSKQTSRQPSRQLSRRSSICSDGELNGISTDPLNQIIDISENEKAVFDLHYQNPTGDLITVAMYDVPNPENEATELNPSLIQNRLLIEQKARSFMNSDTSCEYLSSNDDSNSYYSIHTNTAESLEDIVTSTNNVPLDDTSDIKSPSSTIYSDSSSSSYSLQNASVSTASSTKESKLICASSVMKK